MKNQKVSIHIIQKLIILKVKYKHLSKRLVQLVIPEILNHLLIKVNKRFHKLKIVNQFKQNSMNQETDNWKQKFNKRLMKKNYKKQRILLEKRQEKWL